MVFLGFRGDDRGGSWGQRARRAEPRTKALAWVWGPGSVQMRGEGPATRFPYTPARCCGWRTLPRQSAAPSGAAVAMSLNLNGLSSPFPSKAVSRLYFKGSGLPAPHPVQREVQEFCVPPDNKDPTGGPTAAALGPELLRGQRAVSGEPF